MHQEMEQIRNYWLNYFKVRKAVNLLFEDAMKKKGLSIDLSLGWSLIYLLQNEGISLSDFSNLLSLPAANVTRKIKTLADQNLIIKKDDPYDSRKYNLYFTEEGRKLAALCEEVYMEILSTYFDGFTSDEMATLFDYFNRISSNLETLL